MLVRTPKFLPDLCKNAHQQLIGLYYYPIFVFFSRDWLWTESRLFLTEV